MPMFSMFRARKPAAGPAPLGMPANGSYDDYALGSAL
jgi:hypothetical protein